MALETVQAVRNAELKASQMEKDALQQKEAILQKVEQEKEQIIHAMTKDALERSAADLEEASRQVKVRLEKAVMQAENEILLLNAMVKNKEQSAIKLVLEDVI